jgi:hypothetical protein
VKNISRSFPIFKSQNTFKTKIQNMHAKLNRMGKKLISPFTLFAFISYSPVFCQSVQLEPDRDNTMYSEDNSESNGVGIGLFTGRTNGGDIRRGLLRFDVAGNVPVGATITSVSLTVTMDSTSPGAQTIELHKLTDDWGEGTSDAPGNEGQGTTATTGDATWASNFHGSSSWASSRGDFSGTVSGSLSVGGNGSYTWTSTSQMVADVQDWLGNGASNFGWIVTGNAMHIEKKIQ